MPSYRTGVSVGGAYAERLSCAVPVPQRQHMEKHMILVSTVDNQIVTFTCSWFELSNFTPEIPSELEWGGWYEYRISTAGNCLQILQRAALSSYMSSNV